MNENNILAAILTVAYNSALVPGTTNHEKVLRDYETFQKLLQDKERQGVPEPLKPALDHALKEQAARQKRAS